MKNAQHPFFLLGRIFALIGGSGTLFLMVLFFIIPAEQRIMLLSCSAFPVLMFAGLVFIAIGRRKAVSDGLIRASGLELSAKPLRIFKGYGRRPVRAASVYAAELEIHVETGSVRSTLFFYGSDYQAIHDCVESATELTVIYSSKYPERVIFP